MDVRFDHEGVGTGRLGGLRHQLMSGLNDPVVDLLDGFRPELGEIVLNPTPVEVNLVAPVADAHDLTQGPVLLGEVLELVVVEITSEANRGQHEDLPIGHAPASTRRAAGWIDIAGDVAENGVA
jgi:hypothetical protein